MATTPLVEVPERAVTGDRISMSAVMDHHAPELSAPRQAFFDALAKATTPHLAANELLRLAAAEVTGCRLCRNLRHAGAMAAGIDEAAIDALRRDDAEQLGQDLSGTVALGKRFLGRPSEEPGCAAEVAAFGPDRVAGHVMALAKALTFGKVLVALGVEPESMPVTAF